MLSKAQHSRDYRPIPGFLRSLREGASLSQRDLGSLLTKPQSWIYNCETGNRRVDIAEFIAWAKACGHEPKEAFDMLMQTIK